MNDVEVAKSYLEGLAADLEDAGLAPAPMRPVNFGVTIREYMEAAGCTEGVARKTLSDAVTKGMLCAHRMNSGEGANAFVYCRPKEWPPK